MTLEKDLHMIYRYLISIALCVIGLIFTLQLKPFIAVIFYSFGLSEFFMVYKESKTGETP